MKTIPTVPTDLSLLHDKITQKLAIARSTAHQVTNQLTLIQQHNRFSQQQIQESETRIDQLLEKLESLNFSVVDSTNRSGEYGSVPGEKRPDNVEQLQQQIQQRNELLRQSAHDLKISFGIIGGGVSLLNQARNDEEHQQLMGMLQNTLQQTNQLLTQLLDVTRLEAGQERRQLTTFDVVDLLSGLARTIQPMANEKNLWVRTRGVRSLLIEGDSVKLQRITQNLLLNAIQYTHVGGVLLSWKTGVLKQEWCLTVTDTGPGLSADGQQISGEGVGLLIAKKLCAFLDGRFSVVAPKGGGTQFVLSFPRQYSDHA